MASRRILLVAGARPNFMKVAALDAALRGRAGLSIEILHTGQHAGEAMSEGILRDLGLPAPDHRIELGAVAPAFMAARLYVRIREHLERRPPDLQRQVQPRSLNKGRCSEHGDDSLRGLGLLRR